MIRARLTGEAAKAVRAGAPWVYRPAVTVLSGESKRGALVEVVDAQNNFVGRGLWAEKSPIAVRLLSRDPNEVLDEALFERRIRAAIERRQSLASRDAYRVIHAESDLLPGLFVDRYGPALVVQTLSEGMDARKAQLVPLLAELVGSKLVVIRDDGSGRDFEQLPREKKVALGVLDGPVAYHEGKNRFEVDLLEDAKTGGFLDQVDNHVRAGELSKGRALDAFSYHGGFALQLARSCSSVVALEQDETAAQRARDNARRNGLSNVEVRTANAFDALRELESAKEKFDTVVVDPPGLAKRKSGVQAALRAYHELNLRAFKLVAPNGLLVTCSCSGKLSREEFEKLVVHAAADAKRVVQVLERRGAGIDHPPRLGADETEYLKAWFLRVM